MSYNGSGVFQINTSGQPVVAGTVITASAFNALTADLATGLTTAITKDGQTATTAQIPFAAGLRSTLTTDSTTSTSGSIITDGGLGVAKAITAGTTITGTKLIPTGTSVTGNGMYLPAANTLGFSTNGTNAVNIDASQNVGVGVTPSAWSLGKALEIGYVGHGMWGNATNETILMTNAYYNSAWKYSANNQYATQYAQRDGQHIFYNAPQGGGSAIGTNITFTQAMTLDASGNLIAGDTATAANERLRVVGSVGNHVSRFVNTKSSTLLYGPQIAYSAISPNDTGNEFITCVDSTATRMTVRSNGGIANYSANDVNLSDRREKTNFAPAKSYLDVICSIPVQTYNYIDQNLEEDNGLTLGVVAQDVQAVAPELVMESNWGTEDEPKMRLSIYQTDLQYALMKCIQEQQATITALTARIEALEA
jgi:hypothetical protein